MLALKVVLALLAIAMFQTALMAACWWFGLRSTPIVAMGAGFCWALFLTALWRVK